MADKTITASSPAKIHLIGEYSAVFGKPTIVFPIDLHLTVILKRSAQMQKQPFQIAIEKAIEAKYHKKIPPYSLKIQSNIPIGSCVGSSSALSASLTKALLEMLKVKANTDDIFEIAVEGDKIFHGFPSGSDLKAIILQKPLWYRKETPGLILVKTLDFKLPKQLKLFLIHSGKPQETTREMVTYVKEKIPQTTFGKFANDQEELTKTMFSILKNFNSEEFTRAINQAQQNLEKINVVSPQAKEIVKKVQKIGGAAKINGAGGRKNGSGMLVTFHKKPEKLILLAKQNDWEMIPIKILQ